MIRALEPERPEYVLVPIRRDNRFELEVAIGRWNSPTKRDKPGTWKGPFYQAVQPLTELHRPTPLILDAVGADGEDHRDQVRWQGQPPLRLAAYSLIGYPALRAIKRVKRGAFGMRVFEHYRIRALLYAGKPNWGFPATITPR